MIPIMPGRPQGRREAETTDSLTGFGVFGKGAIADFPFDKSGYVDNDRKVIVS